MDFLNSYSISNNTFLCALQIKQRYKLLATIIERQAHEVYVTLVIWCYI